MTKIIYTSPGVGFLDGRYVNVTGDTMSGELRIIEAELNADGVTINGGEFLTFIDDGDVYMGAINFEDAKILDITCTKACRLDMNNLTNDRIFVFQDTAGTLALVNAGTIDPRYVDVTGDTMTGNLTTTKINLTNTANTWDDITTLNDGFTIQSTYAGANAGTSMHFASPQNKNFIFGLYADGGDGSWGPQIIFEMHSVNGIEMRTEGPFDLMTSNAIGTGADQDDFISFRTTSNVPEITTVGACDLKINAGGSNALLLNHGGGNVGIETATPTARLHLPAGTATASTAPLKLTGGTALGTPEAGALEFHDSRFYITSIAHQRAIDRTSDVAVETVTVANTTTETTLWTGVMDADSLVAGNLFKFHCDGIIQNDGAAATEEVTLRIKVGLLTVATLNPTTRAIAAGSHWHIDANATQRTLGAAGARAVHIDLDIDGTTMEIIAVASINTTIDMTVTVTAQWASADANNTISLYQGFMEYKN